MHRTTDGAGSRDATARASRPWLWSSLRSSLRSLVALAWAAVLAASACGSSGPGAQEATRDTRADFPYHTYPAEIRADCEIVAQRCSKCHTLDRVLVARVESREHWDLYVKRMRRMPGSGISSDDADAAVNCLAYRSSLRSGGEPRSQD